MTISIEKVSLLVDNTNVVSDPVIAFALIKKKMICELMLKENFTPKSVLFFVIANKKFILTLVNHRGFSF